MTTTFEYVPFASNLEHLERHFGGALTIGSKFYSYHTNQAVRDLVNSIDGVACSALKNQSTDDGKPRREVIELITDNPVGTDALVAIEDRDFVEVVRDAGTPSQVVIKAILSTDIPETSQVSIIAAPYGPTGKAGLYTVFPGDPGKPFPNSERQVPEEYKQCEEYWNKHGFLATGEELAHAMREMQKLVQGDLNQDAVPIQN